MNAYEIAQIEKSMRSTYRLPLSFTAWAEIEHEARQARSEVTYQALSRFVRAAIANLAGVARQVRSIAANCTDARLRHDH